MPCFHPLRGYRTGTINPATGKRGITLNPRDGYHDLPVSVPCGQCTGCRLKRSQHWAIRCMHEASLYPHNAFITLTYDDAHLPKHNSLQKSDHQNFLKRLRKSLAPQRVRFYHCGEYGALTGRPHYHTILFNHDFSTDRYPWARRNGQQTWRSPTLEKLWPLGASEIGSVTFKSAAYVARYIMKKATGPWAKHYYSDLDPATGEVTPITPEYTTMSRRPGIGREWLDKWLTDVYPSDEIILNGHPVKPPRYYDSRYELIDRDSALEIQRQRHLHRNRKEETAQRLAVREACTIARTTNLKREL